MKKFEKHIFVGVVALISLYALYSSLALIHDDRLWKKRAECYEKIYKAIDARKFYPNSAWVEEKYSRDTAALMDTIRRCRRGMWSKIDGLQE